MNNSTLFSHIADLKDKSATESLITNSNFLSVDEISEFLKSNRSNNEYVDTFIFGGYDEAERRVVIFVPRFYCVNNDELSDFLSENDSNPLCALKIVKDKFSKLTHRDYLGALMGLGLKREMIGDIIVNEDGCIIFCLKSISSYIIENLKQAGRGQLSCSICEDADKYFNASKIETAFLSVASLRLDCVVAAAFNLSRSGADEAINQGLVYVNSVQLLKTDRALNVGDKLVLRGKGKVVISEEVGKSKKGRLHINIKRYL